MKKKLDLAELKIDSFVTGMERLKGGELSDGLCPYPTIASCAATCDCVEITREQWCVTLFC